MLSWSVTHLIFVQINVASALVKFSTEIVIKSVEESSSVITNAKTLVIKTARHVIDLAPKNALTRFVPKIVVRFVSNVLSLVRFSVSTPSVQSYAMKSATENLVRYLAQRN